MTLTIYGVARSRTSRVLWTAGELGLSYEHIPVIQARRLADPDAPDAPINTRSLAFLNVNPAGQIPTIDDDGLILTESLAIPHYLARKHGGPFAPNGLAEEARATNWALFAATQLEPHTIVIVFHRLDLPEDQRNEAAVAAAMRALKPRLRELEQVLAAGGGYLLGDRFTVADLLVAEVLRYAQPAPELFEATPAVTDWLTRCQSRPAYKAMQAMRAAEPA